MKNVPDPFPNFQTSLIPTHSIIIVGLSGGPDSIYLLDRLYQLKDQLALTLIAAHLDHEWQESSKVAIQHCQQICQQLGITLVIKKLSELKFEAKWNGSQEEVGRLARRHFFITVAQEYEADLIALAHHKQDQQETFFIRLLRGSSLTGLIGMQEQQELYIRPMLNCTKQEILDYLHQHNIAYYTDPTNTSDAYLRNRIRNHVIPALQYADKRFDQNFSSTLHNLAHVEDFLELHVRQTMENLTTCDGIALQPFLKLHKIIQYRILLHVLIAQQLSFTPSQALFKEIMRFLEKSVGNKHVMHTHWIIRKTKTNFMIEKMNTILTPKIKPTQDYSRHNGKVGKSEKNL